jgi:hypothetical protein
VALKPEELAAIVAAVAAELRAPAVVEPATVAPAAPVAASPFTLVGGTAAERATSLPGPIAEAYTSAPEGKRAEWARQAAAYHAVAGYSCDNTSREMAGPDGTRKVGHGFVSKRETGIPCPTSGCTGHIA